MKNFLATLALFLAVFTAFPAFTPTAHADLKGAPFIPEVDARFNALEGGNTINSSYPHGAADGHYVKQSVQVTYDYSKHSSGATGTYDLGQSLPANAVITDSGVYSITKPTTSASGTLAFYCQNANNILNPTAAASFGAAGAAIAGTQDGTVTNWSTVSAKCDINAVVATGALTAGKVTLYLDYVVHQ